jgi:hypothetical protein
MIGSHLLRYNPDQRYLLFDKETFNLNLITDNPPWQSSWILATKDQIIDTQDHFLDWKDRFIMSKGARRTTGYSEEKIALVGQDPLEVWNKFEPVFTDESVFLTGHNILGFDLYPINQWAKYVGRKPVKIDIRRCLDTNALARMMKLGIKPDRERLIQQQYSMGTLSREKRKGIKTSLGVLAKEFGIEVEDKRLHDSLYDLSINFKVLQKLLWTVEI